MAMPVPQNLCDEETGCDYSEPVVCDDGDACTQNLCDEDRLRLSEPVVCDDGDACTTEPL